MKQLIYGFILILLTAYSGAENKSDGKTYYSLDTLQELAIKYGWKNIPFENKSSTDSQLSLTQLDKN